MIASFLHSFFDTDTRPTASNTFPLRLSILVCLIASLVIAGGLSALLQIDFPVIQFIRATHVQFLENIGRIGNRLGHGSTLVFISAVALLGGYVWKQQWLKQIGVQTLLAHGIAGLITQIIKHSIGRPRPRFAHQEHWLIGPSFQSGIDAFPSGHSSASFAVAAVFARHFPRYAWVIYGSAAFVAFSRIIKGSHFPSDACVGALLGYAVGYVLSRPLGVWRTSFIESLAKGLPYFVGGFGLLWIAVQKPAIEILYFVIIGAGTLVAIVGYGVRIRVLLTKQKHTTDQQTRLTTSSLLIALGLALCTGSFLVTVLATLSGAAWWAVHSHQFHTATENPNQEKSQSSFNAIANEVLLGIGIIFLVGLIYQLRGMVPLV